MSFSANQYNYATPLSSSPSFNSGAYEQHNEQYFALFSNMLDGNHYPVSGDVGIWGTSLSDDSGVLAEPFVITVDDQLYVNAFSLVGYADNFPVAFSVHFYSGDELRYTIDETANNTANYCHVMQTTISITRYVVSITKISKAGAVAQLLSVFNPVYIKRHDIAPVRAAESNLSGERRTLYSTDMAAIQLSEAVHITNILGRKVDTAKVGSSTESSVTNVHTRMKDASRRIYGKVYITYTDPMLDSHAVTTASATAYNSNTDQLMDSISESNGTFFTLYENDLSGKYHPMSDDSQVGWVSGVSSNSEGVFVDPPFMHIGFSTRPVTPVSVYFDDSHGCLPIDFYAVFSHSDGTTTRRDFINNASYVVQLNDDVLRDVNGITIGISKVSKPSYPVAILELPVLSTLLYRGYQDASDLVGIDLLEELTYDDDVEALGGISANEATVILDNSNHDFYANSNSSVAGQLKRNRKIEPLLGVEIVPGKIEWYKQGTFWSYRWDVPVNGLTATVVGFDTIGLLGQTDFINHQLQRNKSIGELIEYVLVDAKQSLSFLTWNIDPALYDVIIPYAWFDSSNHAAALRKISGSYPMHIYCDKEGTICAAPQKLKLDYHIDTWSDSTNVISKAYDSLHTAVPNVVTVTVIIPHEEPSASLVTDNLAFDVANVSTRTLNFSKPYVSDLHISVDKDASVTYTYEVYDWGIEFTFGGSGMVYAIECVGTALDVSNTAALTRRDTDSVRMNGVIPREVRSDFIQTSDLAATIISRIFSLSEYDKYDATVNYRGDIAVSINDPIRLLDGIAPDNRYNLRRHKLSWNGALTGSADLNT